MFPFTAVIFHVGNSEESVIPLDAFQKQADVQRLLISSRFLQLVA